MLIILIILILIILPQPLNLPVGVDARLGCDLHGAAADLLCVHAVVRQAHQGLGRGECVGRARANAEDAVG